MKEDKYIQENYLSIPIKTIARNLNRSYCFVSGRMKKLNLTVPKDIIEKRKLESRFKKGNISFNKGKKQIDYMSKEGLERSKKTRFKKGNEPHNTKYDGAERITKDGYIEIRLSKGKYRLKHLFEWEKVNGKVKKGSCLKCIDGNKLNTNPNNWMMISRVENMYRNSSQKYPEEVIPSLVLVNSINKKINSIKNGKK